MALLHRDPADPPARPTFRVLHTAAARRSILEGDEDAWRPASAVAWGPSPYRTTFRALWDEAGLYLRFDCEDDGPWWTLLDRDARLWEEEVVEIFLDPSGEGRGYVEVEISPANVVCDLIVHRPWPSLASDAQWHWDGLESRVCPARREGSAGWSAMASLPWRGVERLAGAAARTLPPSSGDRWRFNVFRIKRPHGPGDPERDAVYAAWSVPDGPSFHVPAVFRDLVFDGADT